MSFKVQQTGGSKADNATQGGRNGRE